MNKAGKHGMDTLQTMQKRSGIYQDRVDGKLPMDRVKGHYAQARLAQDAKTAAKNAKDKPVETSIKNKKGQTFTKTTKDGKDYYSAEVDGGKQFGDQYKKGYREAGKYQAMVKGAKEVAIEKMHGAAEKSGKKMSKKAQSKGGNIKTASKQPSIKTTGKTNKQLLEESQKG